ncbi:unnamed protein product [Tuber aestivum]|uniref:Uncharacterized protein n=1 Tax=Tuber aestivum TaxID=59557 RepID=A0A292Q3C8_9PEZI|nr:unnamed protein product [Tuber aestivum]
MCIRPMDFISTPPPSSVHGLTLTPEYQRCSTIRTVRVWPSARAQIEVVRERDSPKPTKIEGFLYGKDTLERTLIPFVLAPQRPMNGLGKPQSATVFFLHHGRKYQVRYLRTRQGLSCWLLSLPCTKASYLVLLL